MNSNRLALFLLPVPVIVACSSEDPKIQTKPVAEREELLHYDLQLMNVDEARLSEEKRAIYKKLKDGEGVRVALVTELILRDHAEAYRADTGASFSNEHVINFVKDLSAGLSSDLDRHALKVAYEMNRDGHVKAAVYNKAAVTIAEIADAGRLQCYSGTLLDHVINRTVRKSSDYSQSNPVVIFQTGHILPGYVTGEATERKLHGIETTVSGAAHIEYEGLGLYSGSKEICLADADHFAMVELFKSDLRNPTEVRDHILALTAKRYGIDPCQPDREAGTDLDFFNATPFAFGSPTVPAGDQPRVSLDRRPYRNGENITEASAAEGPAIIPPPPSGFEAERMPEMEAIHVLIQERMKESWFTAAEDNDIALANRLLDHSLSASVPDSPQGNHSLYASRRGLWEFHFNALKEEGRILIAFEDWMAWAKANVIRLPAEDLGSTALHIALARGHIKVADLMLNAAVEDAPIDYYGVTTLISKEDDLKRTPGDIFRETLDSEEVRYGQAASVSKDEIDAFKNRIDLHTVRRVTKIGGE